MSFLETDRCYTDKEITATFGDVYDHPQIHDGYKDDGDYDQQPFRFVKNWSLWSSASGGVNPHALPDGYFDGKKYLEGFVVPPRANKHYDEIKIRLELTKADYVSVDRSKRYRGFWIIISNGNCYWLHEPDESIHHGAKKSQADVHFDHIAWLAVLSNLMDAVFTLNGSAWANESVTDVFERLKTPANNDKPPFDKDLLIQYKDKIYRHLLNSQVYLTAGCRFMKSLKSLKPPQKKDLKNRLQIKESTDAAIKRSQQHPWGEPKCPINDESVLLLDDGDVASDDGSDYSVGGREGKVDNAAKKKKKRRKKNRDSPETAGEAAAAKLLSKRQKTMDSQKQSTKERVKSIAMKSKKRTVSLEVEEEKKKEYNNDGDDGVGSLSTNSRKRLKHQAAATARLELPLFAEDKMREALKLCDEFLVPKPSDVDVDASRWTRVQAHEFCIKDKASAESLLKTATEWEVEEKVEWCLLVVEAFRQSCRKGQSKEVRKVVANSKISKMVFNAWRKYATTKLREEMGSIKGTTELFLLISIVGLIAACELITSKEQLNTLKNRGVDWQDIVDKTNGFIEETGCRSKKLSKACEAAQKRIDAITASSSETVRNASAADAVTEKMGQPSSGTTLDQQAVTATRTATTKKTEQGGVIATAADRQQQLAKEPIDSADTQVKDKTIVEEDTQAARNEAIPKKNLDDEKRRQHEADEIRRQRILQLTSRPTSAENAVSSLSNSSVAQATAAKPEPARQGDELAPSVSQTTTFIAKSAPQDGGKSMPPEDPTETQSWIPKVYLPWDATTLMPPPYFVAHAESLGFPQSDWQQQGKNGGHPDNGRNGFPQSDWRQQGKTGGHPDNGRNGHSNHRQQQYRQQQGPVACHWRNEDGGHQYNIGGGNGHFNSQQQFRPPPPRSNGPSRHANNPNGGGMGRERHNGTKPAWRYQRP